MTMVMVPIKNEGTQYSNLTLILDGQDKVLSYGEAHFAEKSRISGHVTSWTDGKKTIDRDVYAPTNEGVETQGIGDAISELNRCLSAAGIPAWIVAAATAVCSFGSIPGYIACLTAAGVGGGTAGYCGAAAWSKL